MGFLSTPPPLPSRVAAAVRRLQAELGDGTLLLLFGSAARGAARPRDFDLAVWQGEPILHERLAALRELASDAAWPYRVDLCDLGRASEAFRASALEAAALLAGDAETLRRLGDTTDGASTARTGCHPVRAPGGA